MEWGLTVLSAAGDRVLFVGQTRDEAEIWRLRGKPPDASHPPASWSGTRWADCTSGRRKG